MEPRQYKGFRELFRDLMHPTVIEEGVWVRIAVPDVCPIEWEGTPFDNMTYQMIRDYFDHLRPNNDEIYQVEYISHNNCGMNWFALRRLRSGWWGPEIFLKIVSGPDG